MSRVRQTNICYKKSPSNAVVVSLANHRRLVTKGVLLYIWSVDVAENRFVEHVKGTVAVLLNPRTNTPKRVLTCWQSFFCLLTFANRTIFFLKVYCNNGIHERGRFHAISNNKLPSASGYNKTAVHSELSVLSTVEAFICTSRERREMKFSISHSFYAPLIIVNFMASAEQK